ncbi:MAG: hypothetical protein ACK4RG_09465 [Fimbriimonadales bacterium]
MEALWIQIGESGKHIGLRDLERVTHHLQNALRALASEQDERRMRTDFEIVEASVGSLQISIVPTDKSVDADWLFNQFVEDVQHLTQARFRPTMFSQTLAEYQDLFEAIRTTLSCKYQSRQARIDESARQLLKQNVIRTVAYDVCLVGRIESVNIHTNPYTCNFYTKLEPRQRVRCIVPEGMLHPVADALKVESLVEIIGNAEYGPVGIYPLRFTLTHPPKTVQPNMEFLRRVVRSLDLVPEGISAMEYLQRLRDEHAQAV